MTASSLNNATVTSPGGRASGALVQLTLLIGAAVFLAGLLLRLAGPPEIPSQLPDLEQIRLLLTRSEVTNDDAVYVASWLAWLALGHLTLSIALRLALGLASRMADGSTWTASALRLSDFVTLPFVRRIVDGALVATLVLALWARPRPAVEVSAAAAEPLAPPHWAAAPSLVVVNSGPELAPIPDRAAGQGHASYLVRPGESLWGVARRLFGDGTQYRTIFQANEGKVMATGQPFTDARLIEPGWSLEIPLPAPNLWASQEHLQYRVQAGDSLWGIAESFLGDGFRWIDVWRINQGREMSDGRPFTDPDLIFPGWVLELPVASVPDQAKTEEPPVPEQPSTDVAKPTVTPTPEPTFVPAAGVATAEPESRDDTGDGGGPGVDMPPISVRQLAVAGAGVVLAGGAMLAVRALATRSGETRVNVAVARRSAGPAGDAGKVVLAARALSGALLDLGFDGVRVVLVRESARYLDFFLECRLGDADAITGHRFDLGRRLACAVDASIERPTRVLVKLSRFQRLAGLLAGGANSGEALLLVPVGVVEGKAHYLNIAAVGSVAIHGTAQQSRQLLSSWLATLTATCGQDELALLIAGFEEHELAANLTTVADEQGRRTVADLVYELREMIIARESGQASQVNVVAVAGLPESSDTAGDLETILRRGPDLGIYLVAVAPDGEHLIDAGATVAFGDGNDVLRAGVASTSSAGPNQLTLSVHGVVSVTLEPIEVRRHAMPGRETEPNPGEGEWPESPDDEALREPDEVFDVGAPETASDVAEGWPDEEWDEDTPDEEPEEEPILQPLQGSLLSSVDGEHRNGTRPLAARALFKVRCFGSFEVTRASGERLNWRIQKARELLAYLIARGDEAVMREEVAEALWPDGLPEQLDRLLSNAAYQLRQAFKGSGEGDLRVLEVAAQRYRLRRELFQVDMEAFLAHIKRAEDLDAADALAEYTRALEIYQADFLAKEPFDWASPYRLDLQKRFLAAAHRAAKAAFDCRDTSQALQFYRAVLDRDPLDEEAARGSMRCYAKLADTNGVRKVYKVLKEALRRELEDEKAEPLPETRTLFEELTRVRN